MYEDMYELSLERGPSPAYDATTMVSTTLDGSPGLDLETSDLDEERRRELRAFLMDARSRFGPGDVGLPATKRRRVLGLRRGEVAELIGVSLHATRRA
jgi:hypothetical protein